MHPAATSTTVGPRRRGACATSNRVLDFARQRDIERHVAVGIFDCRREEVSLLFPVWFWHDLGQAWQATESIMNYRAGKQDSLPENENSLQISVKTGNLDSAETETGSPLTPRTANK